MKSRKLTPEQLDDLLSNTESATEGLELLLNNQDSLSDDDDQGSCHNMEDPDDHLSRHARTQSLAEDMHDPYSTSTED